ncbi:MAG: PEGA domain-containing protein [Deltaproteobacteria bacterium]|nr:PEGA domain-containing protein [Deltaproteobacteria bacterium]
MKTMTVTVCLILFCGFGYPGRAPADNRVAQARARGEIKLEGKYKHKLFNEGKKQRRYIVLEPMGSIKLKAQGPVRAVMLIRGQKKEKLLFKHDLDGELLASTEVDVSPKVSKGLYMEIPEGQHRITLLCTGNAFIRLIQVRRDLQPREVRIVFNKPEVTLQPVADKPEETKPKPVERPVPGPRLEAKDTSKSVLVMDMKPIGDQETAARQVTTLVAEVLSGAGLTVSTLADIKDQLSLEESKQLMGCSEDTACMAKVSGTMKSDLVVTGSVGAIGSSLVLNLTLIDIKQVRSIGRSSETLQGTDQLSDVLPGVLATLFGWELAQTAPKFKLAKGQKLSFAVFDLVPSGVSKDIAENLTQILSVEIKRVEGASVISRDDMTAMLRLEEDKTLLGCSDDTSCIAEIGGALGVDKLVVGHVGKLSESYIVSLRLIDPREAKVESRITESFRGEPDQLIRAIRHAGRKLLGIGADAVGKLAVSASEESAAVYLDDEQLGVLPMAPLDELTAGRHMLRVTKDGYFDFHSDIYIDPHETTAVWAGLKERPTKWYQEWWFWTIVGTVVAGAGVTTAVLLTRSEPGTGGGQVTFQLQVP